MTAKSTTTRMALRTATVAGTIVGGTLLLGGAAHAFPKVELQMMKTTGFEATGRIDGIKQLPVSEVKARIDKLPRSTAGMDVDAFARVSAVGHSATAGWHRTRPVVIVS